MIRVLIITLLFALNVRADIYYVRTDGNDSNTGTANTAGGAWATWGKAASTVVSNDVVRSGNGGTFNEVITETTSGVTYVGNWSGPYALVRGMKTTSASNHKWIGFAETHTDTSFGSSPNTASGTYSNVWYIDCIITNAYVGSSGYGIAFSGTRSYCGIRGCTITGLNTTVGGDHNCYGIAGDGTNSHHITLEYNFIEMANDFVGGSFGQTNIFRNHWHGRHSDSGWSTGEGHSDGFQLGSDGANFHTKHVVIESIFMGTNGCRGMAENDPNGHWLLLNDVNGGGSFGDTNILARGSIIYGINNGSSPAVIATDKVTTYDNTLHDFTTVSSGQMQVWRTPENPTLNGTIANSVFSVCTGSSQANEAFGIEANCTVWTARNWGYLVGTDSSFAGTTDPLFVNPAEGVRDFHLQSGSPLRGAGTNVVWITSASGSGTSFVVNDSQKLCDGFGMVEGDIVQIGATVTRITSISWATDTVTVAASVTWTQNDPVYWRPRGSQKDIGALPYGSADLTAATISANGTTYTVTSTGDARGVWFYVDGIPTTWDYDVPYQQTIASGSVTAKAYALYAQQNPVVTATVFTPSTLTVDGNVNVSGNAISTYAP